MSRSGNRIPAGSDRARGDAQRVLLAGDAHGNTGWMVQHVLQQARKHRCQLVLQLGDFGFWTGTSGQRYLEALDKAARRFGISIFFIDGNHEAFADLYALPLDPLGRRQVRENIFHLPRGYRWIWAARTMLACGGAASVDVMQRLPGVSWWPQEVITAGEVDACIAGGAADVLFSHDINLDVEVEGAFDMSSLPYAVRDAVYGNRLALQRIVDATGPVLQVHGHWHFPKDQRFMRRPLGQNLDRAHEVRVVSLNCDIDHAYEAGGCCVVLDLDVLESDVINSVTVVD